MQGGGDSDTVSVLSQHHSLKPEPEVTGPLESTHTIPEALKSEAARVRKVGFLRSKSSAFLGMCPAKSAPTCVWQCEMVCLHGSQVSKAPTGKELMSLTAMCREQELAGALDFSGSSKPGLPTQLQSFSQEIAPKGTVPSQDLAKYCPHPSCGTHPNDVKSMTPCAVYPNDRDIRVTISGPCLHVTGPPGGDNYLVHVLTRLSHGL